MVGERADDPLARAPRFVRNIPAPMVWRVAIVAGALLLSAEAAAQSNDPAPVFELAFEASGGHSKCGGSDSHDVCRSPRPSDGPPMCSRGDSASERWPFTVLYCPNNEFKRDVVGATGTVSGSATTSKLEVIATVSSQNHPDSDPPRGKAANATGYASYHQRDLRAPVEPGRQLQLTFEIRGQIVTGPDDPGAWNVSAASNGGFSVRITSDEHVVELSREYPAGSIHETVELAPLTIGASGKYSVSFGVSVSQVNVGTSRMVLDRTCGLKAIPTPSAGTLSPGDWTARYSVSERDGLILTDVKLGPRGMASKMSLPYLDLDVGGFRHDHCELHPDDGMSTEPCASRLVDLQTTSRAVEATYVVDHIDPERTGSSCLKVVQRYELSQEARGCEPTNTPCFRFFPTVSYEYLPDDDEKEVTKVRVAQRIKLEVDGRAANTGGFFGDRVAPPVIDFGGNPMRTERSCKAIENGRNVDCDNWHQTSNPSGVQQPVLDFTPGRRGWWTGCPECVHIHWRWGPLAPMLGGPGGIGSAMVPAGSNQDVTTAVVRAGDDEHPSGDALALANGEGLLPTASLAFWYVATGKQKQDTFFTHGGFFTRATRGDLGNRVAVDTSSGWVTSGPGRLGRTIAIRNVSGGELAGPFAVVLSSLPEGVTLLNAAGRTIETDLPYVMLDVERVPADGVVRAVLRFAVAGALGNRVPLRFGVNVFAGGVP